MRQSKLPSTLLLLTLSASALWMVGCEEHKTNDEQKESQRQPEEIAVKLTEYVNPFIGTDAHGHTFPGSASPFGLVQLSPDTRYDGWDSCSGYHYTDSVIYGFSHTHLSGTGAEDLCDILFIPTASTESYVKNIKERHLPTTPFRHEDEEAHAGYYAVTLGNKIKAELTTTPLTGIHRYTYPKGANRHLVIDLVSFKEEQMNGSMVEQVTDNTIQGYHKSSAWTKGEEIYFFAKFSQPIDSLATYLNGNLLGDKRAEGDSVRAFLTFPKTDTPLEVFVGLSTTSIEEAKANLVAETAGHTFDELKAENEARWEKVLGKIRIPKGRHEDLTTFYTALYHSYLTPNRISDVSGSYRGLDGEIHTVPETEVQYSTLSLWDTYRCLHPFFTLFEKEATSNIVRSILNMYDEEGELPIWPLVSGETRTMIGYHSVSVIADAYLRGIGGFSPERALDAMIASSDINKKGSDLYAALGYVPFDQKNESVSQTLEYTYDDWAIYMMAEKMGQTEVAEKYRARALNYTKLFHGGSLFFVPKSYNGYPISNFDPYEVSRHYTEANAFQYRFAAQHDVNGMIQLYGGTETFLDKLENLYTDTTSLNTELPDLTGIIGQYIHGNEPSHHISYLFTYAGRPWRTQELTRKIITTMYSSKPDGIPGNEDCGQMSAWYLFSALGFYPVTPGTGEYVLTAPIFEEAELTLDSGKTLKIKANNPSKNGYIKRVLLNGIPLERLFVTYDELMEGGELTYELTNEPVKEFVPQTTPYSLTQGLKASPVYTLDETSLFDKEVSITLHTATPNAQIRYTLDGSRPTEDSPLYVRPIILKESATICAIATGQGAPSEATVVTATKANYLPPVPEPKRLTEGLKYTLYTGSFDTVHTLTKGKKKETGTTTEVSERIGGLTDNYGLHFSGYIKIVEDGIYELSLTSDDGSLLSIDDRFLLDNDGSHSATEATGLVALQKGLHKIEILYIQGTEDSKLSLGLRKRGQGDYSNPLLYN